MKIYERAELQVIFFEADDILTGGSDGFLSGNLNGEGLDVNSNDAFTPN